MAAVEKTHYDGGAAEYYAAAWFLGNGYQVWWPSMQHGRADFLVSKDGRRHLIQVKKGQWASKGFSTEYLRVKLSAGRNKKYLKGDYDFLVVVDGQRLWKIPFVETGSAHSLYLDKRGPNVSGTNNPTDKWRIA